MPALVLCKGTVKQSQDGSTAAGPVNFLLMKYTAGKAITFLRKLIGNMVQKIFFRKKNFSPQEIYFSPQEIYFSARKIFFSARNIFFSARNIFSPQEIYFSPQEIYFSARNIFFPQEIFFSARNIFLRKKYFFLRKKYIFSARNIFFPQEIFFSARNIFVVIGQTGCTIICSVRRKRPKQEDASNLPCPRSR